jgi:putative toxin-antitoxin system antitoxin component (TIGR02293 family)
MAQMRTSLAKAKQKTVTAGALLRRNTANAPARKTAGGVVRYWVLGPSDKLAAQAFAPSRLIKALKAGLPVGELDDLRRNLDLPMDRLAPMLGISKATLHRRKNVGRLDATESDRVVRFARLLGRAAKVMESLENGRHWLTSPQVGLGGAIPLEYAETEIGAREVEDLLGRIEYGVYS